MSKISTTKHVSLMLLGVLVLALFFLSGCATYPPGSFTKNYTSGREVTRKMNTLYYSGPYKNSAFINAKEVDFPEVEVRVVHEFLPTN